MRGGRARGFSGETTSPDPPAEGSQGSYYAFSTPSHPVPLGQLAILFWWKNLCEVPTYTIKTKKQIHTPYICIYIYVTPSWIIVI